jgi:RimJ/RimL family protein N-acetyltransferase
VTYLRDFYDVMGACGMLRPPWEAWRAAYSENAELWPITDRNHGDKLVGGVLFKDHTVHIAIAPEWQRRWVSKALLRAYKTWAPACDVYATPAIDNTTACKFAERLGFQRRGETEDGQYAIYVKEATCPRP